MLPATTSGKACSVGAVPSSVNPDCGCLHLPRDVAFAKLCAMVEGARIVRKELGG